MLFCSAANLWAENVYVDSQNGQDEWTGSQPTYGGGTIGPKATIAAAIAMAGDGDVVTLATGTYQGQGNRDLEITQAITLRSQDGLGQVVVDCGGLPDEAHQGITIQDVDAEVSLEGLWIVNGYGSRGGGVNCNQSRVKIINCMFSNHKMGSGGAIFSNSCTLVIERCAILGNTSSYSGGGIDCWNSTLRISNSLMSGNRADRYGGGLSVALNSDVKIINCTLSQNRADLHGGGLFCRHGSKVSLSHTILWANQTSSDGKEIALINRSQRPSTVSVAYCNIEGDQAGVYVEQNCILDWGKGNMAKNPLFIAPGQWDDLGTVDLIEDDLWLSGDLHLQDLSPCIDAGSADFQPALSAKDFDGNSRMVKGWVDIGAYETQLEADWMVDDDSIHDPGPGETNLSDPLEDGSSLRPFDAIQEAIDAAQNGDSILIRDGVYRGIGNRDLIIEGKSLLIRSENGAKRSTIDCERLGQGFYLDQITEGELVLDGLTILRGGAVRGGGIYCRNSSATIINCIITDNQATSCGGGIYCEGDLDQDSFVVISNNEITGNQSGGPGGGIDLYYFNLYPHIVHNLIAGNQSAVRGGGISIFTTNTPAIIVNNTITANRCPIGGGIAFHATSGSQLSNCIIWDNQADKGADLYVQQFGELFLSDVAIDYSDFSGGELAVPVSFESSVNWGENNLTMDPCFVQPGYFDDPNTANYPYDDFWVEGDYHLNYRSAAIDAGNNGTFATLAALGVDTGLTFNGMVDLGAFEYRGIDPDLQENSGYLRFNRITVKAGNKPNTDSFTLSGELEGIPDDSDERSDLTVRVGPYVETLYSEGIQWNKEGDKFSYKNRSGGITSAKVDLKNQTFMISAKGIDLTGLEEPLLMEMVFENYFGFGRADEKVINAKKVVPIDFMSGFANTLRVGKVKAKSVKSRQGDPITRWTIIGEIALAQGEMDLSEYRLRIHWAGLDATLFAGDVATKGPPNHYQYQRKNHPESPIAQVQFDLKKHTFTLVIEGELAQADEGEFQLIFEKNNEITFDETVRVDSQ